MPESLVISVNRKGLGSCAVLGVRLAVSVGPESLSPTTLEEAFLDSDGADLVVLAVVGALTDEADAEGLDASDGFDLPPPPHPMTAIRLTDKISLSNDL